MKEKENQNIQVYVRLRPLNQMEKRQHGLTVVEATPERREIVVKEKPNDKLQKTFHFDRVFDQASSQIDVYKSVVGPLLEEVLLGYNCTVFAYGQTGTGKTFTMEGERSAHGGVSWEEDPLAGIIPRALHQLFEELKKQFIEYSVRVSFLELYNEELFDLLSSLEDTTKLRLYEDCARKGSVIIQGLEELVVHSKDEVYAILEKGALKRQTATTLMNANSSRSHTVFSITVHIKENNLDGEELMKTGKLNLVDLAGSENIGRSGAVDKRAREAGNINQSLLTLGRVITSLVERAPHVPYRESKLTRLLQESLGGRTKTSIIATISPSSINVEETLSTLEYAHRAKNITNRPEANQKLTKRALIKEYTEEIERLKRDLIAAREKNGIYLDEDTFNNMNSKLAFQSEELQEKYGHLAALKEELEKINKLFDEMKLELECRSQQLQSTKQELKSTKTNLNKTFKLLRKTTEEREEKSHLIDAHVKTESILSGQATQLLQAVDMAKDDSIALHSKLEKKLNIENQNEQVLITFRSTIKQIIGSTEERILQFGREQIKFCENLRANFDEQLKQRENELDILNDHLISFTDAQTQNVCDLNDMLMSQAQSRLQWVGEHTELSRSFKDKQILQYSTFKSQTLSPLLDSVTHKLNEQSAYFGAMKKSLTLMLEQQMETTRHLVSEQLSSMSQLSNHVEELIDEMLQALGSVNEDIGKLEEEQEIFRDETQKLLIDLSAKIQNRNSGLDTRVQNIKSSLNKANEKAISAREKSGSAAIDQFHRIFNEHNLSQTKQITTEIEKSYNECFSLNTAAVSSCTKLHKDAKVFNKKAQTAWEDHFNMIELATKHHAEVLSTDMQKQHCQIATIVEAAKECAGSHQALMKQNQYLFDADVTEQKAHISKQISAASDWTDTTVHGLKEFKENTEQFLLNDLKKCVPTGLTPQRREYIYPTTLAATSPHERILQRYRIRQDLKAAANFALPSTDSDLEAFDLLSIETISGDMNTSTLSDISSISSDSDKQGSDDSKKENLSIQPEKPKSRLKQPKQCSTENKLNTRKPFKFHQNSS